MRVKHPDLHGKASPCINDGQFFVVKIWHKDAVTWSQIKDDPDLKKILEDLLSKLSEPKCPVCGAPWETPTSGRLVQATTDVLKAPKTNQPRGASAAAMKALQNMEISTLDANDLKDADFKRKGGTTSFAHRYTNSDYVHSPAGGVSATMDASPPVALGLKSHAYPSFKNAYKFLPDPHTPGVAIKKHYSDPKLATDNANVAVVSVAKAQATALAGAFGVDLAKHPGGFEWCHVRADSLGGIAARENLFCGSHACNTFMLCLEDIIRLSGLDIKATVTLHYTGRAVDPNTKTWASRDSSRLFPEYVAYELAWKGHKVHFLIWARAPWFSLADREQVHLHVDKTIGVAIGKLAKKTKTA